MTSNFTDKLILLVSSAVVSSLAQAYLKYTSNKLPSNMSQLFEFATVDGMLLVLRVGLLSGTSLALTWYAYRKFGFIELVIAQSLGYVFYILVAAFIFEESVSLRNIASVILILIAIALSMK
jgi:hypothetical protein